MIEQRTNGEGKMKLRKSKKILGVWLSAVMLAGMVMPVNADTAGKGNYLTDASGVKQAEVGKMTADNHEIIDVNITDGKTHKVTIYLLDEDASGRWTMVDVIDPDTQKILDNQNIYDFSEGVYLSYNISGHIQIRLTNVWTKRYTESADTAVHGVFIDGEDAVENGTAVVTTDEPKENTDAQNMECVNVLGRFADAGENFTIPFDKEAQSVEMRFDGSIDPSSENIDQIQVLKDGKKVAGEMRTSFYSVTFKPEETMRDGSYEVIVPASLKNTAGEELGEEYRTKFEVEPTAEVVYFLNGMNLQTRRVELTFNDRLKSTPAPTLVYNKGEKSERIITTGNTGQNAGKSYEIQETILPSGNYTFTLPKGVVTVSGAESTADYKQEFEFDSTELSAKISAPYTVEQGQNFDLEIKECIGYNEVRYAFSEEALKEAEYEPVEENIEVSSGDLTGDQTLYVQFKESGVAEESESPVLHKAMRMGVLEKGQTLPFDMQSAGVYDKDGFGSTANKTDGVFDMAGSEWIRGNGGTTNYIADGANGLEGLYDLDKDGMITTEEGIEYQLSTDVYIDGRPNVATGNGKSVPAPSDKEYETIYVLAAGHQQENKGTFTLTYADGTSETQEITAHKWDNANSGCAVFKGISTCLGWWNDEIWQMGYMHEYELEADPTKVLESVTLPKTNNYIRVFAMTGKEADKVAEGVSSSSLDDVTSYQEGSAITENTEDTDITYDEFMELYGDDPVLANAADVTDVTNITEVPAGPRTYDPEIEAEKETPTGAYGQSLYPYERQPEKLMSYKIRMQIYGQTSNNNYELDFEDALEAIRRVDNLTRGLEKKCYLVGWQLNGHDTGFPDLSTVNPRHKRPMDETSLESLKWLIKEAKEKYNTTITLHVNFSDAYTDDDPLSPEMLENQLMIRNADGSLREMSVGWAGHKGYYVSAPANYFTGNWQNNIIKPLLTMLPELEGQSVHPDAWYSHGDPYYGLTSYDTTDAQRRSAKYLRETYDMDLTTEFDVAFGAGENHPEDHNLYFPMIWQRGWSKTNPLMTPSYIQSGVNELAYDGVTLSASGRYFGEGTAVEPTLWNGTYGPIEMPGLKQSFAEKELTRQYLNTLLRSTLEDNEETGGEAVLYAGDGTKVVSAWDGDATIPYKRTVTAEEDVVLQEPGNVFMPMTWRSGLEIQAWSQNGYTDHTWKLPKEWADVASVDIYDLSLEGLRYMDTAEVSERTFLMSLDADQSVVIVPEGANPNSTEDFDQNGTVQFIGRDTETDGNWTKAYGSEGYEIFDGELGANMPESVEVSYVNGTVKTIETGVVEVDSVILDKTTAELEVGDKLVLNATVTPDNATDKRVVWSSSNPETVSVSENGEVMAITRGSAVITASAGNAKAECTVTVVTNVSLDELKELLEEAKAVDLNKYTKATADRLAEAIMTVENELNSDLSQDRINELYDELKTALDDLEEKTEIPDGGNGQGSDNGQSENNGKTEDGDATDTSDNTTGPQTGDEASGELMAAVLAVVSAAVVCGVILILRRKKLR